MTQILSDEYFLGEFISSFEELHSAVTGSKKILQFENVSIYEETLPTGKMVKFYFFHGNEKDQERLLPWLNEREKNSYCVFHKAGSTITVEFKESEESFECDFGYSLLTNKLLYSWEESERNDLVLEAATIQVLSHEIRHEIQHIHSLSPTEFRTTFEGRSDSFVPVKSEFDWKVERERLGDFYQEAYVESGEYSADELTEELDAIITSYLALCEWFKKDSSDNFQKLQKIAGIIKGTQI